MSIHLNGIQQCAIFRVSCYLCYIKLQANSQWLKHPKWKALCVSTKVSAIATTQSTISSNIPSSRCFWLFHVSGKQQQNLPLSPPTTAKWKVAFFPSWGTRTLENWLDDFNVKQHKIASFFRLRGVEFIWERKERKKLRLIFDGCWEIFALKFMFCRRWAFSQHHHENENAQKHVEWIMFVSFSMKRRAFIRISSYSYQPMLTNNSFTSCCMIHKSWNCWQWAFALKNEALSCLQFVSFFLTVFIAFSFL